MHWSQHVITLQPQPRGFHLITQRIVGEIADDLVPVRVGLCHLFICHTSASLSLNENADPDVRVDLETAMNRIAPESGPYLHTCEGPDDMPAHVKSSVLGASLTVPIRDGRLCLGTWQGIYLAEHRNHASARRIIATIQGSVV